jgi:hypothetical protein
MPPATFEPGVRSGSPRRRAPDQCMLAARHYLEEERDDPALKAVG